MLCSVVCVNQICSAMPRHTRNSTQYLNWCGTGPQKASSIFRYPSVSTLCQHISLSAQWTSATLLAIVPAWRECPLSKLLLHERLVDGVGRGEFDSYYFTLMYLFFIDDVFCVSQAEAQNSASEHPRSNSDTINTFSKLGFPLELDLKIVFSREFVYDLGRGCVFRQRMNMHVPWKRLRAWICVSEKEREGVCPRKLMYTSSGDNAYALQPETNVAEPHIFVRDT